MAHSKTFYQNQYNKNQDIVKKINQNFNFDMNQKRKIEMLVRFQTETQRSKMAVN